MNVDYATLEKRYYHIVKNEGVEHLELVENLYPPIIPCLRKSSILIKFYANNGWNQALYGFLLRHLYENSDPPPPNLIDVAKWQNASKLIAEPLNYQKMGFNFLPMNFIQRKILDATVITDEDEMISKSRILLAGK